MWHQCLMIILISQRENIYANKKTDAILDKVISKVAIWRHITKPLYRVLPLCENAKITTDNCILICIALYITIFCCVNLCMKCKHALLLKLNYVSQYDWYMSDELCLRMMPRANNVDKKPSTITASRQYLWSTQMEPAILCVVLEHLTVSSTV